MTKKRRFMKKVPTSGRHCPACGNDVGWAPGLKSVWPMSVTCPYCEEELAYVDTRYVATVIIVVALGLCIGAFFIAAYLVPYLYMLLRIGLTALFMMIMWVPVVVLSGMYLRSHKLLAIKYDGSKKR